jgi:hypothetical protein
MSGLGGWQWGRPIDGGVRHDDPHLDLFRDGCARPGLCRTKIGSLFVHPGGPGSPGTDFIRTAPPPVIGLLIRRFDLVGVDLRGEGDSKPTMD